MLIVNTLDVLLPAKLHPLSVPRELAPATVFGLGEPPPTPTWGNILHDSQKYIRNAPWIAIFPGCAIAVSVLGLNLFGDAVRDAMDPRLRT